MDPLGCCLLASCVPLSSSSSTEASIVSSTAPQTESQADPKREPTPRRWRGTPRRWRGHHNRWIGKLESALRMVGDVLEWNTQSLDHDVVLAATTNIAGDPRPTNRTFRLTLKK